MSSKDFLGTVRGVDLVLYLLESFHDDFSCVGVNVNHVVVIFR